MFSVSHIDSVPSSQDIAGALESASGCISDSGNYRNRRGSMGYYPSSGFLHYPTARRPILGDQLQLVREDLGVARRVVPSVNLNLVL